MPNKYRNADQVVSINGQRWVNDFLRLDTFVVILRSDLFFGVHKYEIWNEARRMRIIYSIRNDLYSTGEEVFAITGGYNPESV